MVWIMDSPAMHHMVQGMAALNLTWFQGERHNLKY
jgi:hypothetical protein